MGSEAKESGTREAPRCAGYPAVPRFSLPVFPTIWASCVRVSKRKAKLRPHASQAVPEAVADADSRIVEDPQFGWLGRADVDSELELIGDLEWTLTGQRELGRREEVIVNKGDPDIGHKALHIQTERVPNFQAVLKRSVVRIRAPGLSYRGIPRRRQPGADAQDKVLHLELEEVADPSSVQEDKIFFYVQFPSWRALDGRGSVESPAETSCHIRFDRPPPP